MTRQQKYRLVFLFTAVWVAVIFAPIFFGDFRPPAEVNGGLPTIIGALLAVPTKEERNNRSNRGDQTGNAERRSELEGADQDD